MRESSVASPRTNLNSTPSIQITRRKPAPLDIPVETDCESDVLIGDKCSVVCTHMIKATSDHACQCSGSTDRYCWSAPPRTKNRTFTLSVAPTVSQVLQKYDPGSTSSICSTCVGVTCKHIQSQLTTDMEEVSSDEEVFLPAGSHPINKPVLSHGWHYPVQNVHGELERICKLCGRFSNLRHVKRLTTRPGSFQPANICVTSDLLNNDRLSRRLSTCSRSHSSGPAMHSLEFCDTCGCIATESCYAPVSRPHCRGSTLVGTTLDSGSFHTTFKSNVRGCSLELNHSTSCPHSVLPFFQRGQFSKISRQKSQLRMSCMSDYIWGSGRLSSLSFLPHTAQLLFHMLSAPPIRSLHLFTQLIQRLSPSLQLTSECRLPWHTSNRKSSGRVFHSLLRTCPKNTIGLNNDGPQSSALSDERKGRSALNSDPFKKPTRELKPDSPTPPRRTYATVVASPSPLNEVAGSWLTPAEASRIGLKRCMAEERSHSLSSITVRGEVATTSASSNHKFSIVSARTTNESGSLTCAPVQHVDTTPSYSTYHHSYVNRSPTSCVPSVSVSSVSPVQRTVATPNLSTPVFYTTNSAQKGCMRTNTPVMNEQFQLCKHECCSPVVRAISLESAERNRSVFVDLTGYDVTVSVERLPPVGEVIRHLRGPDRKLSNLDSDLPTSALTHNVPANGTHGVHSDPLSSPHTSLPVSPPPPYSECGFSPPGPIKHSSCLPHSSADYMRLWQYSLACFPPHINCPNRLHFPYTSNNYCWCQFCVRSHQLPLHFQLLSPSYLPEACSCMSPAIVSFPNPFCATFGLHPVSMRHHCAHSTTTSRMDSHCEHSCLHQSSCGDYRPLSDSSVIECPTTSINNYVYVPEPIRVSRSQDVYNALRTCLVPHYELRDYFNSAPPQRQWRKLEELSKDGFPFTLMCYNLLSPNYATPNMYPYCPSWALSWDYRRRFILDEIRMYHANIICLQEVETDQFEEIFKPELEKLKYDAVFLPKSRRRTMDIKDCKKVDGCAIFWQVDKFEKLHEFHHEFMYSCSNMCENPTPLMLNRVMTRDNVALGVIFETKGPSGLDGTGGRQFCVTTGHIHWDPELSDVKMIQTILWTAELWAYIDQFLTGSTSGSGRGSPSNSRCTPLSNKIPVPGPSSPAAHMPVILCGDLNSLPESGVVEFLMRGSLPKTHTDFLNNGFEYMFEDWRLLEKWAVDGDTLRHRFAFDRAYRESQGMRTTNYTYEFKGMIDYVLFSRQHFRLLGSLDQIHESWFTERKILGCPHAHFPSDHFALLVELELKPTSQLHSLAATRICARNRGRVNDDLESHIPLLHSSPSPTNISTNDKADHVGPMEGIDVENANADNNNNNSNHGTVKPRKR